MGLLRRLLWPGRKKTEDEDEEEEKARDWKRRKHAENPGLYRIEVDGESRHMKGEGPPFSFWGSSRITLILAFLLWWIQPAGPMIAGYVGGRRAGSPTKAILAALMPVIVLFLMNAAYAHAAPAGQADFVASLPQAIGDGTATILPFVAPYKDFVIAYMTGFVSALQTTFGMGTNGYLMVVIFAYIGGLVGEQTRRELYYKNGASQSVGLNLIQPILGGRRHPAEVDEEEFGEDEELREMRRPTRASARGARSGRRHRRGSPDRFDDFRKVHADTADGRTTHHPGRLRARGGDDEDEGDEVEAPLRHIDRDRHESRRAHARGEEADEEEDEEAVARREAQEAESRKPRLRSREEEMALQRFVERALRNYEHSKG